MTFFLCRPGDSATCAILEVARAISAGPSSFAVWSTLIVPVFAAFASTLVAVVSVYIANRARKIAEASETARITAETQRVTREQQQRLDTAIRDLFVGIAGMIRELEEHEKALRIWERTLEAKPFNRAPEEIRPGAPSDLSLLALVAAARLESASEDEREMLDAVTDFVTNLRSNDPGFRMTRLSRLWKLVVEWRHAPDADRPKKLQAFKGLELAKTPAQATRR